jgi:hypothetical protein
MRQPSARDGWQDESSEVVGGFCCCMRSVCCERFSGGKEGDEGMGEEDG